jgi:phenylacetate-CoA ligase
MNARGRIYLSYSSFRGSPFPRYLREYLEEDARGVPADTSRRLLARMLRHCRDQVPYYAGRLRELGDPEQDPEAVLAGMPVLTKQDIREHFDALKSSDLSRRRWTLNTSGGSTGEPARFIQDWEYNARSRALTHAFGKWVGHEIGEPVVRLWGSERDALDGTLGWRARAFDALTRTTFLNAFRMTPQAMRDFARKIRIDRPKLVIAYAQALYELAGFLEQEGIQAPAVGAAITSAGTLHDFMRSRIERVFQCPVYNRYGSREVSLIASERPGIEGMWVAPWNTVVEIVDDDGQPVPPGMDGEILVTSLVNFAMPLVRYRIGDRGSLSPGSVRGGQVLRRVLGRNVDAFRRRDGTIVDGEYFTHLLYFRNWVEKFQFIQIGHEQVVLRVVARTLARDAHQPELDSIAAGVKAVLGPDATLQVEWVDEIPPPPSGKHSYTISKVLPPRSLDQRNSRP